MRCFIALEIPKEIKKEIELIQEKLKQAPVQAHWVKPELCHLTLAFLGSITPEKIALITQILKQTRGEFAPFELKLANLDCFPTPLKSKITFINLEGETGKLKMLVNKIRRGLKKGRIYFDEKPFIAHLTLGRIKKPQNLTKIIKEAKTKRILFTADKITLIQSQLTKIGPIYQTLISQTLQKC